MKRIGPACDGPMDANIARVDSGHRRGMRRWIYTGYVRLCVLMFATGGCSMLLPEGQNLIPPLHPPSPSAGPAATAPVELAVPGGYVQTLQLTGAGVQVYECRGKGSDWAWNLIGPQARLYDERHKLVGSHSTGPIWTLEDGSQVRAKAIAHALSKPLGSIDQLLLKADSGNGQLAHVAYIQRLHTVGGALPADPCSLAAEGKRREVDYSALYLFYQPAP